MSNRGPAPYWKRNAGFGCQDSGPGRLERGHGRQRGADVAALDQPPGGLQPGAEEGVRGAAEPQPGGVGRLQQPQPGFAVQRERLFGPDVLAGVDGGRGHFHVRGRDGQVDDDFDVGVVQCRVHPAPFGDAVFLGPRLGGVLEEVGDDVDLQVREDRQVVQVLLADVAGADDGDAHRAAARWLRRSCARAPSAGAGGVQVGEALGDAVEDVAGVVVELHDAHFQGLRRGDDVPARRSCPGRPAAGPWCPW